MPIRLFALAVLLLVSACSGGEGARPSATATTPAPTPSSSPTPTPTPAAAIEAANAAALRPGATFKADAAQRLVWSSTGVLWVVGTRTIDEVDPATGTGKHVFELREPERILALSPEGLVATTGEGPTGSATSVRLRQLGFTDPRHTLDVDGVTTAATFFGGNRVALVSGAHIRVSIWDTATGQRVGELTGFETASPVYNVAISDDGTRAAWVARATLQFMDAAAKQLGARVQTADFIGAYAFAPDGRTFASATGVQGANGTIEGRVQLWDPATGTERRRLTPAGPPLTLAFAPSAPLIAVGGAGVTFWSTADGSRAGALDEAAAGDVRLLAFSRDGATLATFSEDGTVRFWRAGR